MIALGEDVVNRAYDSTLDEPAPSQIEMAEQSLYDLASFGTTEGGFEGFSATLVSAINMAEAAHKRQGQLSGVTTGLKDLDGKLGGLHNSDLIILAGRPSMANRLWPPISPSTLPRFIGRRRMTQAASERRMAQPSGSSRWRCRVSNWRCGSLPNKRGFRPT